MYVLSANRILFFVLFVVVSFSSSRPASSESRLAVLPFRNIVGDENYDWLGDGFSESLTTGLAQIEALRMIERSMIEPVIREQRRGKSDLYDPEGAVTIGKLLGAEKVMIGSYQILSETILVNARIVNVETGVVDKRGSANNLVEKLDSWYKLYERIIELVTQDFSLNVTTKEKGKIESITGDSTRDITAYEAYILGKKSFLLFTPRGYERAIEWFGRAIEIDPSYALAYSALANACTYWGFERSWSGQSFDELLSMATSAAETGVKLEGRISVTHSALALVYAYSSLINYKNYNSISEKAIVEARIALSLNQNDYEAYFAIAQVYVNRSEGIPYYKKAIDINPNYAVAHNNLAITYSYLGYTDKAIGELNRTIALSGRMALAWSNLASVYFQLGWLDKAEESLQMAKAITQEENAPFTPGPYSISGMLNLEKEKYQKATIDFNMVATQQQVSAGNGPLTLLESYWALATANQKMGNYSESIALCKKALALETGENIHYSVSEKNYAFVHMTLSSIYDEIDDQEKVDLHRDAEIDQYLIYLKRDIDSYEKAYHLLRLALSYITKRDFQSAVGAYAKAQPIISEYLEGEPSRGRVMALKFSVALYLFSIGSHMQSSQAIDYSVAVLESIVSGALLAEYLDKRNLALSYDWLGWIAYNKGSYEPAVEYFKKALQISENDFLFKHSLRTVAEIYSDQLDDPKESLFYYALYLEHNPGDAEIDPIRKKMAELRRRDGGS